MKRIAEILVLILLAALGGRIDVTAQTWSDVGGGVLQNGGGSVEAMCVYDNELYVVGAFKTAGSIDALRIARWDGAIWDSVGSGSSPGIASSLGVYAGDLFVGGNFQSMGGVANTWSLASWDNATWSAAGTLSGDNADLMYSITQYNGEIYVGGNISSIGGLGIDRIARWDGNNWDDLGGGVSGGFVTEVRAMAEYNGELYVGGDFTNAGGTATNYIAKWNGISWDSVGGGVGGPIISMVVDTSSNVLYVGGPFYTAGGQTVNRVAKWDNTSWSAVGVSPRNPVAMEIYDGKLYIGGISISGLPTDTTLACWDGNQWQPIYGPNNSVTSLRAYAGDLYIGGLFDEIDGATVNYIARYNNQVSVEEDENMNTWSLGSCVPNPSDDEVNIPYSITHVNEGYIHLHSLTGSLIKSYYVQRTSDEIIISLQGLADGTYIYSLELEGEIVESKKLVISR